MSEFGKGYAYCLGLFLAHAEKRIHVWDGISNYGLWFNGAGDHIFEFDAKTPRALFFKNKVLRLRLEDATKDDFLWAIQEAKDLLLEYDKSNGVDVEKGDYQ